MSKASTMIRSVDDFVAMLGGTGHAAECLQVTPSYVSNMLARGYLPTGFHMKALLEIEARGLRVSPEFFDLKGDRAKQFSRAFPRLSGNAPAVAA